MNASDPHGSGAVLATGSPVASAKAAMIMLHGRGADAADILGLAELFPRDGVAYIAPEAFGHTWYPRPSLSPREANEPYLSSALARVGSLVFDFEAKGMPSAQILLLGFSQGACLALDYAARNAKRYGGVVGLSGGLIGATLSAKDYPGSLDGTPVFMGCSDVDPHIPKTRVEESADILRGLGAAVTVRIYPGMGHNINEDEAAAVKKILDRVVGRGA